MKSYSQDSIYQYHQTYDIYERFNMNGKGWEEVKKDTSFTTWQVCNVYFNKRDNKIIFQDLRSKDWTSYNINDAQINGDVFMYRSDNIKNGSSYNTYIKFYQEGDYDIVDLQTQSIHLRWRKKYK